ncbi:Uma2 family endonuclease, partial [Thiococcus pfennigii]|uniref:Uma2 family endonuclease n=1 Tax=Thiococcus pfennigii TaxID=1057 RepID=UPI001907AD4E
SVGEWFRMGEAGILAPDARYELIDGEIVDMSPIGPPHAGKTNRLTAILAEALHGRAIVSAQNPIILGDFSAPQPDVAILRYRDDYYEQSHPTAPDVLLLIEVADTSLAYDRGAKLTLYARYRVPEVWIVDIPGGHLDIHRDPDGARYTRQFRVSDLSSVEIVAIPGMNLDLRGLF